MGADKTLAKLLAGTHNVNSGAQASPGPGGRVASPSALDQQHTHGYAHTHTTPGATLTSLADRSLVTATGLADRSLAGTTDWSGVIPGSGATFGPSGETTIKFQNGGATFSVPNSGHTHGVLVSVNDHRHTFTAPDHAHAVTGVDHKHTQAAMTTDSQSVAITDTGNPTAGRYADLRGDAVGFLVIMKVKNT